jgi:hypothetical protein
MVGRLAIFDLHAFDVFLGERPKLFPIYAAAASFHDLTHRSSYDSHLVLPGSLDARK